eukprot:7116264-Pyramimonas_sp.AAC.1
MGIIVVTRAKFMPNAALAFGPCDSSWHAVKRMAQAGATRDSIQGFVHSNQKMKKNKCPNVPESGNSKADKRAAIKAALARG